MSKIFNINTNSAISLSILKKQNIADGKLDTIIKRLEKKIAYLSVEDAVAGYKEYLKQNTKLGTQASYTKLLDEFASHFKDRNVAEIYSKELRGFFALQWGDCKKTTLRKRVDQLHGFFQWCNLYLQEEGSPVFHNPCKLIKVKVPPPSSPDLISPHQIGQLLELANNPKQYFMLAIPATAGLRISEALRLRPQDIRGRIITILNPKSGRSQEIAVVPGWIAKSLNKYMKCFQPDSYPFLGEFTDSLWLATERQRKNIANQIRRLGGKIDLTVDPHDLRRFTATFWNRLGKYAMQNYCLRHSTTKVDGIEIVNSLSARYVARLTGKEVMRLQDQYMRENKFKKN